MLPSQNYPYFLKLFARTGAQLAVAVGIAAMAGWLLDIGSLKSILPGLPTIKMNAACGLFAAGAALWLLLAPPSRWLWVARALAAFAAVLGGLTLAEDAFELQLGIDQLIIRDNSTVPEYAGYETYGRMSPAAALSLLLIGMALLSFRTDRPLLAACAHWLVVPALFASSLALVGYAYGVSALYQIGLHTSIALPTALAVWLLSLAILAADARHGFPLLALSDTAGGVIARRLLPAIPLMLFALGWNCVQGLDAGLYDAHFALALLVMLSIAVCLIALAATALVLDNTDSKRQQGVVEILALNAGLERRVVERTQQLAKLSAELTDANKLLEQLSQHDALTGLPNRRYLDIHLASQIALAHRHNHDLAVVMCDIDYFKSFNDQYGHQAGDECLKQVSAALQSCARRPSDLVARYGGEEFVMVLPETDLSGATRMAEAARAAVARLQIPHAHSVSSIVSISGGVATLRTVDTTAYQLIAAADQCLYEAKDAGRNRIVSAPAESKTEAMARTGQLTI